MKRDPYFDVLKFFAMFLVVFGHTYWAMGCKTGMPYFENFRCGMNMPLFFVISGYFAARTIEAGDWRKLGCRLVGYFWPLAVVSCLFAALAVGFGIEGSDKGLVGYAGRRFLFSAWFLWCLAICFVLSFACQRPRTKGGKILAWSFVAIALPLLNGVWQMEYARSMLPFFAFGAFVLRRWELWKGWRIGGSCLAAFLLGVSLQGNIWENGLSFYRADTTWLSFFSGWKPFVLYIARIVNGLAGSVGLMWLLQVACEHLKGLAKLAPLGTTTLGVYILHQWILARILGWGNPSFGRSLMVAAGLFAFCHVITKLTRWPNSLRKLLWGEGWRRPAFPKHTVL